MTKNQINYIVRGLLIDVHRKYGPGLYEEIYERVLFVKLLEKGLRVKKQVPIYIDEPGLRDTPAFRADIIVEDKVILELKAVDRMHPVFHTQLLSYLKLTGLKLGLLINFNVNRITYEGIERIVNGLEENLKDLKK